MIFDKSLKPWYCKTPGSDFSRNVDSERLSNDLRFWDFQCDSGKAH